MPDNRVTLPEGRAIGQAAELGDSGRVHDALDENWVDDFAPEWSRPYLRLSRVDRPIGTWLLLLPAGWGVFLGIIAGGWHWVDIWLLPACTLGAFLMRGAGCTWNDLIDRDIDRQVARTRSRPIPSGQVDVQRAFLWAIIQSLGAFLILLTFDGLAIVLGILALAPVAAYPFAKRFTWWPQVFLGIAFNWGVLLMYAAHSGTLGLSAIFLYIAGIAWTLHYDTIYAHQDREDDALIGVKSTARLFERETEGWLGIFTVATAGFGTLGVLVAGGGVLSLLGVAGLVAHMWTQIRRFDMDDPGRCLILFRETRFGGLALAAGLFLDALI